MSDTARDLLLMVSAPLLIFAFGFVDAWWKDKRSKREGVTLSSQPIEVSGHSDPQTAHTRIGVLEVMNGRLLEVCSFKRNPHGPDWTTTYWILNDEQPLAEQIAVVLAMKGLAK